MAEERSPQTTDVDEPILAVPEFVPMAQPNPQWRSTVVKTQPPTGGQATPPPSGTSPSGGGSLDAYLPQQPFNIPKFEPMNDLEKELYLPLYAFSRGIKLPDPDADAFEADLYLSHIRDEFDRETRLLAFDAYRRTLELRAAQDQNIRNLFAPIAQDFNSVFSSDALNAALAEVIEAYRQTNPKVSWNKLSQQGRLAFIRSLAAQGKLPPTLQQMMQHWTRLKATFQNYKALLHPQDAMVVAELDQVLGGSFEAFIAPYLTRKDQNEEFEENLRKQREYIEALYRGVPNPALSGAGSGAGRGAGGLPSFNFGGVAPQGSGGAFPSTPSAPQGDVGALISSSVLRKRNEFISRMQVAQGKANLPNLGTVNMGEPLSGKFGGHNFLGNIRAIVSGNAFMDAQEFLSRDPSYGDLKLAGEKAIMELRRLEKDAINRSSLQKNNQQMKEISNGVVGTFLMLFTETVNSNPELLQKIATDKRAQMTLVAHLVGATADIIAQGVQSDKQTAVRNYVYELFGLRRGAGTNTNIRLITEANQLPADRTGYIGKQLQSWINFYSHHGSHFKGQPLDYDAVAFINSYAHAKGIVSGKKPFSQVQNKLYIGEVRTYDDVLRVLNAYQGKTDAIEQMIAASPMLSRALGEIDKTNLVLLPYVVQQGGSNHLYLILLPVSREQAAKIRKELQAIAAKEKERLKKKAVKEFEAKTGGWQIKNPLFGGGGR